MAEIILGSGELYIYEFSGAALPEHTAVETAENNVGHCSGGATLTYKPNRYDVKNQYGKTVKTVITSEDISFKTGILTWDLSRLALLSSAQVSETTEKKTLTFGGAAALPTVLLRFVHTKDNGKKVRVTLIGQDGAGFALAFDAAKETTVDAEITAIEHISGFLASIEEELEAAAG